MVDSRRIHPRTGGRRDGARSEQDKLDRHVPSASIDVGTAIVPVEGDPGDPTVIFPESTRRRSALVYYPATDPDTGTANSAVVWIIGDPRDTGRAFPLEPGAQLALDTGGWLYGYTDTGDSPRLYIIEEDD